jgi:hypothetical protein
MPLTIPAFDQYQEPMFPLRGLWKTAPVEGDKIVKAEIDWLVTTRSNAVQFSLSGNSPVSLSQIVALAVDNSRSGADVSFIFPDSGWELVVPAHNQLIAPVFTNALMFYASSPASIAGDTTIILILNSMPPPVPIAPSIAQNHASVSGVPLTNNSTQLIPLGVNGTLNTISMSVAMASAGNANVALQDGTGKILWQNTYTAAVAGGDADVNLSSLSLRFINGIAVVVTLSTFTAGAIIANAYYSTP